MEGLGSWQATKSDDQSRPLNQEAAREITKQIERLRFINVDFPEPVLPVIPNLLPFFNIKLTFLVAIISVSRYLYVTFLKIISPSIYQLNES